jgi:hypothetical protein
MGQVIYQGYLGPITGTSWLGIASIASLPYTGSGQVPGTPLAEGGGIWTIPSYTIHLHNNGPDELLLGNPAVIAASAAETGRGSPGYPLASGHDFSITLSGEDFFVSDPTATAEGTTGFTLLIVQE